MGRRYGSIAFAFAIAMSSVTGAQPIPMRLNHQGRLFDSQMVPVSRPHTLVFKIYNVATGGTPLWSESQNLPFESGFYSTTLGGITAIPTNLFQGGTLFMGITVDTDSEMTPRESIDAVPYALACSNAVGDITPHSIVVGGTTVVKADGTWGGSPTGLVGPKGATGDPGGKGDKGDKGDMGLPGTPRSFSVIVRPNPVTVPASPGCVQVLSECNVGEFRTGGFCDPGGSNRIANQFFIPIPTHPDPVIQNARPGVGCFFCNPDPIAHTAYAKAACATFQ